MNLPKSIPTTIGSSNLKNGIRPILTIQNSFIAILKQ